MAIYKLDDYMLTATKYNIITALKTYGNMTRRDLVKNLNLPRTTIYDNLIKLQKIKVVEKFSINNGKQGRPLVFWKLKT